MSDPVTTARTARESLARGLNALQSQQNVPLELQALAAIIAQAMGALHQIERSNGAQIAPHAEIALNHTRTALSQLQAQPQSHPAVIAAMEAVAGSLGLVHSLSKMGGAQAAPQAQPAPQPVAVDFPPPRQAPQPAPPGGVAFAATAMAPPQPALAQPPPGAPAPAANGPVVNAELGTQSGTNFYKGLSGNDIIDHGGLFVATYMVPKIGTPVRLRVSLPGGYEFEASAVVKWSREPSDAGDAAPGFGAQFTQITQEARQLVYRYVRNREPLFHDDL